MQTRHRLQASQEILGRPTGPASRDWWALANTSLVIGDVPPHRLRLGHRSCLRPNRSLPPSGTVEGRRDAITRSLWHSVMRVVSSVDIDRPAGEVWAYVANYDSDVHAHAHPLPCAAAWLRLSWRRARRTWSLTRGRIDAGRKPFQIKRAWPTRSAAMAPPAPLGRTR
jgi:hypothetical protein